jgi:hypothetical protein
MTVRLLSLGLVTILAAACARRPAQAKFEIPAACIKVRITDFTKPCKTLAEGGELLCDGVRVHVNCVAVR